MNNPKKIIISGSGISGLLSAYLASHNYSETIVYVVEKNAEIGGLLRCFDYGENGKFDYGAHNIQETGVKELDDIIYNLLAPSEWQMLEDAKRDLAGAFFNNKLQEHSPYIDIRNLGPDAYQASLSDFFSNLPHSSSISRDEEIMMNVYKYASNRFGKTIAELVIIPSLKKIYKKEGHELDYMATLFTPMSRVVMFDEPIIKDLTQSKVLRDRIAYSDQRNLPLERSSGLSAYYPKKYGMYRVVEAFKEVLQKRNVQFLTNHEITSLKYSDHEIESITLNSPNGPIEMSGIDSLIWTSNLPLLGRMLYLDYSSLSFDKPLKTVIVNILVDKKPTLKDLYYFYCYTAGFHTFRVTNFINYCDGAYRNGGYPLAMELLVEESMLGEDLAAIGCKELQQFGILEEGTNILFAKAEALEAGFPMPSVNNITSLNHIRNSIYNMDLKNLVILGVLAEKDLFFQTDVMIDAYKKLQPSKTNLDSKTSLHYNLR
jgi:protoporphyrinogen oxidase